MQRLSGQKDNLLGKLLLTDPVTRAIAERAARAGLRLRFDKVALRLAITLQTNLADAVPEEQSVLITITAPIRNPAKVAPILESLAREHVSGEDVTDTIHGNQVRIRRTRGVPSVKPKVLCFVHNLESDASLILDLAEAVLRAPPV